MCACNLKKGSKVQTKLRPWQLEALNKALSGSSLIGKIVAF